ncbi:MAG: hypothetical protein EYC70_08250 [Planctomycetota bacterium]|nr:MAG: hypothetical protein EYC70_08250 [Planctomycetota bacterium]
MLFVPLLSLACCAQEPLAAPAMTRFDAPTRLSLKTGDWDTGWGAAQLRPELRYGVEEAAAAGYFFVQAAPQDLHALRGRIQALGGRVFDYVPNNAYEAWLPAAARLDSAAVLAVHPFFKLSPEIGAYGSTAGDPQGRLLVSVEFWPDRDVLAEEERLRALGVEVVESFSGGRYQRADVRAYPQDIVAMARLAGVKWIEEDAQAQARNDKSEWVVQTNQSNNMKLWNLGVTGRNVGVGHIDGGRIYESSCYFDDPTGAAVGPNHRKIKWWSSGSGSDSHSTHTAGSAAGDSRPVNGGTFRNGIAPDAFLVHHSNFPSSSAMDTYLSEAHSHGGRLHTNSWGSDATTSYNNWCRDIDAYCHDNEDGLVLFAVSNLNVIKNPENAKSCVGVGATDRTNQENLGSGGGGPTADGRLKPEVWAPGCSTYSASSGASCSTRSMCGTSMACPVVTGAAALLKQYFEDGYYPGGAANAPDGFTPSGSLLRASLANSGDDMNGFAGYPGYREGWGRILLDNVCFFSGDSRRLWVADVAHAQGLTDGQTHTYPVSLTSPANLRIHLAFADEPGSAFSAQPVVNDLDLIVTAPNGTVYRGNVLNVSTGQSAANPSKRDPRNSLEGVLLSAPAAGTWTIAVEGRDVVVGPQGYALVVTY